MLKYETVAEVGQRVKAFDFMPRPGVADRWVEGTVRRKGYDLVADGRRVPYACYEVQVEACSANQYEPGEMVYVPFECGMDYDGRVSLAGGVQ